MAVGFNPAQLPGKKKKIDRETRLVGAVLGAYLCQCALMPAVSATAVAGNIFKQVGTYISWGLQAFGIFYAMIGVYLIFKGMADNGPSKSEGLNHIVWGGAAFAAGRSGLVTTLLGMLG